MKEATPQSRLGVFKSYDEVPTRYQLHRFASEYVERDLWVEYAHDSGESVRNMQEAAYGRLRQVTDTPAFATPEEIEEWAKGVSELVATTQRQYFKGVFSFYRWLANHRDYPHRYNPVLMAASNYPNTATVWENYTDYSRIPKNE